MQELLAPSAPFSVIDAKTGTAATIIEERSKTFVDYSQKTFLYYLDKTGRAIWMSERSGWIRVSPHATTPMSVIEALGSALRDQVRNA